MDAPPFLVVIVLEILKTINLFTAVYSQNICEFFPSVVNLASMDANIAVETPRRVQFPCLIAFEKE